MNNETETSSEILYKFITIIRDKKIQEMIKRQRTPEEEEEQDRIGFSDEDESNKKTYSPILLFLWAMENNKAMIK